MNAIPLLVGLVVALFGRRLFWLFVAAVGFVGGLAWVQSSGLGQAEWWMFLAIALAGVIGALLAILLQKAVVAIAGFLIGGYALANLASILGGDEFQMLAFLVGGVIAAILVAIIFDWALIILSSLAGAILVGLALQFNPTISAASFVAALVLGLAVQFQDLRPRIKNQEAKPSVQS